MTSMLACRLHAVGDLRGEEVPMPAVPPGWALVRVAACGVCGSDLPRVITKGTYRFPLIPGHEIAGEVAQAPGGCGLAEGDRVVVFPLIACGRCQSCQAEQAQLCDDYDYLGSRRDGGWAQYVAAPTANLLRVPPGVDLEVAALTEPAAVARHALRRSGLQEGDTVWIVGAGPIGLLLAQWARALGAGRVVISDLDDSKLAIAGTWSDFQVNTSQGDAAALVREALGGAPDLVVEAVGVPATIRQALQGAAKRGRVVLMGNPAGDVTLAQQDYWQILRCELTLVGTWNSQYRTAEACDWEEVLQAMASGALQPGPLISHRVALPDLPSLLERMHAAQEPFVKVVMRPVGI